MTPVKVNIEQVELLFEELENLALCKKKKDKDNMLKTISPDTKQMLQFLCNPMTVTGISAKKIKKTIDIPDNTPVMPSIFDLINYLKENNTGRDVDIAVVQLFMSKVNPYEDFIEQIVTKAFKLGLSAKTLNAVYGKLFIPTFSVQLAENYNRFMDRVTGTFTVTTKYDGYRCISDVADGTSFSRQGNPIQDLIHIKEELKKIDDLFEEYLILDGELLVKDSDRPKDEWFNETSKIVRKAGPKTNLRYIIFDAIEDTEFYYDQKSTSTYRERRARLETAFDQLNLKYIELAPTLYVGQDKNVIQTLFEKAVEDNEEGIMINIDAPYICRRTTNLLKVKPALSADLEIVGFEPGQKFTKFEDTLGAIIVNFKGVNISVGSGLTDEWRTEIWNNQSKYLGRIAEIKYTSISKNQNDSNLSLRFPVFKTIRDDKSLNDVNIEE